MFALYFLSSPNRLLISGKEVPVVEIGKGKYNISGAAGVYIITKGSKSTKVVW